MWEKEAVIVMYRYSDIDYLESIPLSALTNCMMMASYLNHLGFHFLFYEIRLNNLPHRIAMRIKSDYEIIQIVSPINVGLIIIGIASFPSTK